MGFDPNETFDFDVADGGRVIRIARTARGEAILERGASHDLTFHEQDSLTATFFPYTSQRPRRLDYIWTRGIQVRDGRVIAKSRVLLGSDHDAVQLRGSRIRYYSRPEGENLSGKKQLRNFATVLEEGGTRTRTTVETIQEVSRRVTQRVQRFEGWRQSDVLKQLRIGASTGLTELRCDTWKQVWKLYKSERKIYNDELCARALRKDWAALRTCRLPQAKAWQSGLLGDHFKGIFARQDASEQLRQLQTITARLVFMCKRGRCACSRRQNWTM